MARFLRKYVHHEARTGGTLRAFLDANRPDIETLSLLLRHLTTTQFGDRKTPVRIMDVVWYLNDRGLKGDQAPGMHTTPLSPTALAHVALGAAAAVNYDVTKADMACIRSLVAECVGCALASDFKGRDLPLMSTALYRTEVRDMEIWRKVIDRAVQLLETSSGGRRLDTRGLVGIVFGLAKMAIRSPQLEARLPSAAGVSSPEVRAQLLYIRCRAQRGGGADLDSEIEDLANRLVRDTDQESFLLALHSISLVPYRHSGLLKRVNMTNEDQGRNGRGWSTGSYLRFIADCFRLSCPIATTTALVGSKITYEAFFLYGLRFMGWDLSDGTIPSIGDLLPNREPSTALPSESAAMVLAAFQISYLSSPSFNQLASMNLKDLRKLKRCVEFEMAEVAQQPRYQSQVDELLRSMALHDYTALREVKVEPYSIDVLLVPNNRVMSFDNVSVRF
ncbi:hypothetical protein FOL47_001504 [Perkinsus chesapeaki]|uniref:Uncharacterized protein n=1 Tax=Perkinsus chesapeaki TaxID=330153 RepID=A0A7J6MKK2_PERCH|nr:hypothetical protein FOL47_001504 [Perkinsus chesapeaki]